VSWGEGAYEAAMVKVTGAFQKSSEIMKVTNQLVKLPQLSATMREMSMEMMKVCRLPFFRSYIVNADLN
jgi:division protein CdvB (Snf7/Vps24/ESCRT-III family)